MKKPYSEAKIGLAVLLAMAILIGTILWGKGFSLTSNTRIVQVRFLDIAGLEDGAFVLVNGLRKGHVLEFILEQSGVLVRISLDERVRLYDDAVFAIANPDLMGPTVINVAPGISGKAPVPDYIFPGKPGGGMNELMRMSSNLVDDVKRLLSVLEATATNINKTAGDPRLQEAFLSSVDNLDKSSQRTLELITINEGKLNQVMDNLVVSSNGIRTMLEKSSGNINQSVVEFHTFVTELNEISQGIHQVVDMLQGQEGTLGQLINKGDLALDLKRTLTSVDSLVNQIRDEGITTHVSLFGSKKKK
jgi:phospholipid/cholesterol/gamma-HCH transport system substrate-binding protein